MSIVPVVDAHDELADKAAATHAQFVKQRIKNRHITYVSEFVFGDIVHIDNDESIKGRVSGHWWREDFLQIEVSWICNGDVKSGWFDPRRLAHVE